MGELKEGDAQDVTALSKTIDGGDFTILAAAFNSTPTSGNWNADADFDRDEYVGIVDFSLFYTNYGKISPQIVG